MALALLLPGQKSLCRFENGHMKQKSLHKVYINSAKFWGIKIEIYLTTEVPMGINIDQPGVQRNRYQMTPSILLPPVVLKSKHWVNRKNIKKGKCKAF